MEVAPLRDGVVVGDGKEIEPGLDRRLVQRLGRARRIGMEGVAMKIAPVPAGPGSYRKRPHRLRISGALTAVELDRHRHLGAIGRHLVEPEDDVPLACRDRAIMELFYSSGLRLAELAALDIRDIDFGQQLVQVKEGKGGKDRLLPMGGKAIESLKNWLDKREQQGLIMATALFITQQGRRLGVRSIQQRLAFWGKKHGLSQHVHPHRLRHAFASHMLESSGDLRAVQELLGHADISTTQIYTHVDFQHLAKVYDAAHPRAKKRS